MASNTPASKTRKKNKLAALLGQEVTKAEVKIDKNAEGRQKVGKAGFQLPARITDKASVNAYDPVDLLKQHMDMPDFSKPRFSVADNFAASSMLETNTLFNLMVHVKGFMYSVGEVTEIFVALYSQAKHAFVTDEYCIRITDKGLPEIGMVDCKCLFAALTAEEMQQDLHVVCRIYRVGALVWKEKKNKYSHKFRRPWGVSVLRLVGKDLDAVCSSTNKQHDVSLDIYVPSSDKNEKEFATIHEKVIYGTDDRNPLVKAQKENAIGLALGLQMFPGNEFEDSLAARIRSIKDCTVVRKKDFQGPLPGEGVHELRVDLVEGTFTAGLGRKKSEKNVQVKIELRDKTNAVVPNSVARGQGPSVKWTDGYQSTVFYHLNSVVFNESIIVRLPPQRTMETCHLFMEFSHCSTSEEHPLPFGFSFMRLVHPHNFTAVENGGYQLKVYEYDKKKRVGLEDNYLTLDSDILEKVTTKDKLVIATELRSTEISQDPDIHQLLNWHRSPKDQRTPALMAVARKPAATLAQNLEAILGKMFEILTSTNRDFIEHHRPIFKCLVNVLATVGGRRLGDDVTTKIITDPTDPLKYTRPYMDGYIDKKFESAIVWKVMLKLWSDLMVWVNSDGAQPSDENYSLLSKAMRGVHHVFRMILKSFAMYLDKAHPMDAMDGQSPPEREKKKQLFGQKLEELFVQMNTMMGRTSPDWLAGLQYDAISNFHHVFEYTVGVLPPERIVPLAVSYLRAIQTKNSRMRGLKLNLLREIVHSKVLQPLGVLSSGTAEEKAAASEVGVWKAALLPLALQEVHEHLKYTSEKEDDPFHIAEKFKDLLEEKEEDEWVAPSRGRSGTLMKGMSSAKTSSMTTTTTTDSSGYFDNLMCVRLLNELLPLVTQLHQAGQLDPVLLKHLSAVLPHVMKVLASVMNPDEGFGISNAGMLAVAELTRSNTIRSMRATRVTRHNRSMADLSSLDDVKSNTKLTRSQTSVTDFNDHPFMQSSKLQLPEELRAMDVVPETTALVLALINLLDEVKFTTLLEDIGNGAEPPAITYLGDMDDEDDPPPPPPPPPEDDGNHLAPPPLNMGAIGGSPFTKPSVVEFLENCLWNFHEIVGYSVFRDLWLVMRMLEVDAGCKLLRWLTPILTKHFTSAQLPAIVKTPRGHRGSLMLSGSEATREKEMEVWRAYWLLATDILLADDLQLDRIRASHPLRAQFIMDGWGDVREAMAKDTQNTWSTFQQKDHFTELLVEPIIYLTQSQSDPVRELGRNMYWDLLTGGLKDEVKLSNLTSCTIDAVGIVVHKFGIGAMSNDDVDSYRSFFSDYLKNRLETYESISDEMRAEALSFLSDLSELFGHLIALESLPRRPENEDERTEACIKLMQYLKDSQKQSMYEMYLQYLCELHEELGNHVERGVALMLHASTLEWSNEPLDKLNVLNSRKPGVISSVRQKEQVYLPAGTASSRKILLCKMAISAFNKGQAWERCIEVEKYLSEAYQNKTLDFLSLSASLKAQSDYWSKILTRDRVYAYFYRVHYVGAKFDPSVRDKEFVYRSIQSVRGFTEEVKAKHPDAKIINSSDLPDPNDLATANNGGKFIQITTLQSASLEEYEKKSGNEFGATPPPRVLAYRKTNDVKVFSYARVENRGTGVNEYSSLWVKKTFLVTAETLPSLRRRMEVAEQRVDEINPIQNATMNIAEKNTQLRDMISNIVFDISQGGDPSINSLSMQLSGVIDAAVQGGINKYKEAFFTGDYLKEHPEQRQDLAGFKIALAAQLPLLNNGLKVFGERCDASLRPLHEHLQERFEKMVADLQTLLH